MLFAEGFTRNKDLNDITLHSFEIVVNMSSSLIAKQLTKTNCRWISIKNLLFTLYSNL